MKIEWEYDFAEKPFCEQLKLMGWQWLEGDTDVSYLTERESFREVAWYYAQQALQHNPQNQYVLKYVEAMNLGVKK